MNDQIQSYVVIYICECMTQQIICKKPNQPYRTKPHWFGLVSKSQPNQTKPHAFFSRGSDDFLRQNRPNRTANTPTAYTSLSRINDGFSASVAIISE